jgi:hypothetical protein
MIIHNNQNLLNIINLITVITLNGYYKQLLTFFGRCDKNIYLFIPASLTVFHKHSCMDEVSHFVVCCVTITI